MSSSFSHRSLDSAGAASAGLCAVHCVLSSLWLAVLPTLGLGVLLDERVERLFLLSAVVLGSIAFSGGWRRHRRLEPAMRFALGLIVLLAVRPQLAEGSAWEVASVVGGAAALISAHWRNDRLLRTESSARGC